MRGTIVNRGTSWGYKVYITDPQTGARKQKWFGGFRTRKEAEVQLADMLAKIHGGGMVPTTKLTLAEFLEDWLTKYVAGNVRETSLRSYRDIVRAHLVPGLGRIPVRKVSPLDVHGYYTAKRKPEKPASGETSRALSPSTVRKQHAVLHAALQHAVQNGLLAANVCDRVKPPRRQRKEPRRWDVGQVKRFLAEAKRVLPFRIYTLFLTLRTAGIRPGEALGLRESDVDLVTGAITIRQKFHRLGGSKRDGEPTNLLFGPPKSDKGQRVIEIPPDLVEALRTVMAENARLRREFGAQYHDLEENGPLVFCQDDGRPLNWENIARRHFRGIVTRLKLPVIWPYEFGRHAHAAWLYEQGVHPTIISQRLGHSSTAFTMDTYGYLDRGLQSPVVAKLQAWLNENAP
jgi:integrase